MIACCRGQSTQSEIVLRHFWQAWIFGFMSDNNEEGSHFVLVHGACHGAWCWFKVLDLLRKAGHRATAIDLAASGRHSALPDSITSFHSYNQPLSDFLSSMPPSERDKVILVGHSLGGISVSHVSEEFPGQLAALVYVAGAVFPSGLPFDDHFARIFAHCQIDFFYKDGCDKYPTSFVFRTDSLEESLLNTSPSEDIILASLLMRPCPVAAQLAPELDVTDEGFKSIPKVYIKTALDIAFSVSSQERLAREHDIKDVFVIQSDHSPFFSAAEELAACLFSVHAKYGAYRKAESTALEAQA